MNQELWTDVDGYITDLIVRPDGALTAALETSEREGLPSINIAPNQGKFLQLLVQLRGARRVLEIGTLGGYSAIWLARGLVPGGRLITLEANPKYADVARRNIAQAGLADVVEIRVGPALETLSRLEAEKHGPFDVVFIDADKPNNPSYFEWAVKLSQKGTLIIVDNVIRGGTVVDSTSRDAGVLGTRQFNEALAHDKRVIGTEIQTVGVKGYDGFALALVVADP
jgi:predicted O-methyltransferase YrrM